MFKSIFWILTSEKIIVPENRNLKIVTLDFLTVEKNYAGFFACLKPVFFIGFLANQQVTLELRTDWIFPNFHHCVGLLATEPNQTENLDIKSKKIALDF
jgi:hypothetical protein